MCDYSLSAIASRPAKVGDKLVTTRFFDCITRGFSALAEPNVAVCLLPGTEVGFEKEVEYTSIPQTGEKSLAGVAGSDSCWGHDSRRLS